MKDSCGTWYFKATYSAGNIDFISNGVLTSYVTGKRELVFDDFTGFIGATFRIFSDLTVRNNSTVEFTNTSINLKEIENWNIEAGSMLKGIASNNFAGDILNFNLSGWDGSDWTAVTGTAAAISGLNSADSDGGYFPIEHADDTSAAA